MIVAMPAVAASPLSFSIAYGDWDSGYELVRVGPMTIIRDDITTPEKIKLYTAQRIGSLLAVLVILSGLFALIESSFAARQPRLRRKGLRTDVAYWFLTPLVTSIAQIGLTIILVILYRQTSLKFRECLWRGIRC